MIPLLVATVSPCVTQLLCVTLCFLDACVLRIFDSIVGNLKSNFAEGTEYFKVGKFIKK